MLCSGDGANAVHDDQTAPAADVYDARLRLYRQIVARRGQAGFRAALLDAYAGRRAVTECTVQAVLEAGHLQPYRGPDSNVVSNGLFLCSPKRAFRAAESVADALCQLRQRFTDA